MTKSDELLENINLDKCFFEQSAPTWTKGKSINAFDTETSDGNVFMVSYAIGDKSGIVDNPEVKELDGKEIFDILTHHKVRSALNFWYNLDFDANAILSGVLDRRELTKLNIQNSVTSEIGGIEYDITYVKSKFMLIEDENGNNYRFYDVSQFFYTSLDNAAEEWLGENKIEEVDTSKFGISLCEAHSKSDIRDKDKSVERVSSFCPNCRGVEEARNYIKDNYSKISEYAEKDALLTQRLSKELVKQAEKLNIPMGKPFSTGYLSAEYLRANTQEKPSFHKYEFQDMFWNAYYGGRFEVFERGEIGEIVAPDINSAYPAIMQNLPDPDTLDWEHFSNEPDERNEGFTFSTKPFGFDEICNHDFGVVRAYVTTNPDKKIQPFAYKLDGKVNFPILTETEITVIKPIFEFAVKNNYVLDYRLKEAWLADTTDKTHYPFSFIGDIYADRKVAEVLNDKPKKGQLLKIVLNSLYGKTCQTTADKRVVDLKDKPMSWELDSHEKLMPRAFISKVQRKQLEDSEVLVSNQTAGKRFNPFFASYITGMTRLELHKQVEAHDLVDATVMFATDCLMVRKDAYDKSAFNELITIPDETESEDTFRKTVKDSLGYWDFDYEGKAFIVGSGVYEVDTGKCRNKDCGNYKQSCHVAKHRMKTKTRGFTEKDLDGTLREIARNNPKAIPIENERPLTIGELLIKPTRGNVSEFIKSEKKLYPDFDTKRVWERESPTFHDLLNSAETSKPRNLANEQEEELMRVQAERDGRLEEYMIDANVNGINLQ